MDVIIGTMTNSDKMWYVQKFLKMELLELLSNKI